MNIYIVSNLNVFRPKQSPAPRHTHQGINLTIMVEDSFTAITPFSNYLLHEGIEGKMKKKSYLLHQYHGQAFAQKPIPRGHEIQYFNIPFLAHHDYILN